MSRVKLYTRMSSTRYRERYARFAASLINNENEIDRASAGFA